MVRRKSTNLQFLRFIAALAVLFCHSFSIVEGKIDGEWIYKLTGGQLDFGVLAVCIFFFFSGFLVLKSLDRLKTGSQYFRARAVRLFPPLWFVTIPVIIICSMFSSLGPAAYFRAPGTWKYLLNNLLIPVHDLPGVFLSHPYGSTVNGSLWTLPLEALCYIGCFIAWKTKLTEKRRFIIVLALVVAVWGFLFYSKTGLYRLGLIAYPCVFFVLGMAFYIFRDSIVIRWRYLPVLCLVLVLLCIAGIGRIGLLISWPYIIYSTAFGQYQMKGFLPKLGDYSYGIYLWGFPVQQALMELIRNGMNVYLNFLIAAVVSTCLGAVTYYLVENRVSFKGKHSKGQGQS